MDYFGRFTLVLALCGNALLNVAENIPTRKMDDENFLSEVAEYTEALSRVSVPVYGLRANVLIETGAVQGLAFANKMPEEIKRMFLEISPHFHVLNRTEDVEKVNVTRRCCKNHGCYTIELPFGISRCRPSVLFPMCQNEMKVRFYLWTRDNRYNSDLIDPGFVDTLLCSNFLNHKDVVIYIHDYLGAGDMSISLNLKNAILDKTDCNFISVDWTIGARVNYTKAAANAELVSAATAGLVQTIIKNYNIGLDRIHIIGFGLGAHIAGGAGKRVPELGRITGLDPIKPYFEGCESTVRLTKSDANFVDIIHTDIGMLGTSMPSGHLDFYVNGGISQPACFGFSACNHPMALVYFIESIHSECPYYAYQCESHDDFMRGKCSVNCNSDKSLCAPMGYRADQWKRYATESPTLMFMLTRETGNYCVYHYYVEIKCEDEPIKLWRYGRNGDKLIVNVIGEDGETGQICVHENSIQYTTLPRVTAVVASYHLIGKVQGIKLNWVAHQSYQEPLPLPEDCLEENLWKDACCKYGVVGDLCYICPNNVSIVHVRKLETDFSQTFTCSFVGRGILGRSNDSSQTFTCSLVGRSDEMLFDNKTDFSAR